VTTTKYQWFNKSLGGVQEIQSYIVLTRTLSWRIGLGRTKGKPIVISYDKYLELPLTKCARAINHTNQADNRLPLKFDRDSAYILLKSIGLADIPCTLLEILVATEEDRPVQPQY
jgi:hypothetical protein